MYKKEFVLVGDYPQDGSLKRGCAVYMKNDSTLTATKGSNRFIGVATSDNDIVPSTEPVQGEQVSKAGIVWGGEVTVEYKSSVVYGDYVKVAEDGTFEKDSALSANTIGISLSSISKGTGMLLLTNVLGFTAGAGA